MIVSHGQPAHDRVAYERALWLPPWHRCSPKAVVSHGETLRAHRPHVMHSFEHISEDVYATMQGPEWNVTGNLNDWDVTDRLAELELPVLAIPGRYDRASCSRSSLSSGPPST